MNLIVAVDWIQSVQMSRFRADGQYQAASMIGGMTRGTLVFARHQIVHGFAIGRLQLF